MKTSLLTAFIAALFFVALSLSLAAEGPNPKKIKPSNSWAGSVADEKLEQLAPASGFIADEKSFAKLVEEWKLGEKVAGVDFKNDLVLVSTTRGSRLNTTAQLTDKGD